METDLNDILQRLKGILDEALPDPAKQVVDPDADPFEHLAYVKDANGEPTRDRDGGYLKFYDKDYWLAKYRAGKHIYFVPTDFGGLRPTQPDKDGHRYFLFTLNGVSCWLKLNTLGLYPEAFYHVYQNALELHMESEQFKKMGPGRSPWGTSGPMGKSTWYYEPSGPTFGFDLDGRFSNKPWYDGLEVVETARARGMTDHKDLEALATDWLDGKPPINLTPPQREKKMKQEKGPMPGRKSKKVKLPLDTGADIEGPAKKEGKLKKKTVPGTAGEKASKGKFNKGNLL